ncbi:MAG: glycine cleavage system aminomethyltransferase GcvT [Bacteroidetes bacterium]|nr:glycine cleavage system aminomethyltransferase GcvT [Bacteroidota bacterium]
MKNTPFTDIHIGLGAKMAPFAGYNMPISYKGINEEHHQVRNAVGVFDVSHMGEFILKGENALDLIQRVTSNDASKLIDGQAQYSCMPNDKGGIVDDLLVYKKSDTEYLLVVNASNIEKDWNWIQSHNTKSVPMTNISDDTALLAIQGPKATEALQSLTSVDLKSIPYYHFAESEFAGCPNIIISATGYTGAGGFELYIPNRHAVAVWNKIFASGAAQNIAPIGLAARDTLRLEMGFCLYGNDINDTTNPIEAGLGWITKFTKDFVGRSFAENIKTQGASKTLVGFKMVDKGIPRHDYEIVDGNGKNIGIVTSGTQSPTLGEAIGLGYVAAAHAKSDSEIFIKVRDKQLKAVVTKLPFIKA